MPVEENQLGGETSPYLIQHAGNPVHWRPWGAEALAEAKRRDRPILLSVGYAACHWCHVMAHESFEDAETAALMNRLFVNVKVDREERPDIDHIYMSALHAMGEQGGWPLTMFLTPDGAPIYGGTYWPPAPRWGRPSFRQVLQAVDAAWRDKREAMVGQGASLVAHLAEIAAPRPGPDLAPDDLTRAGDALLRLVDPVNGGIGDAPKFPNAPIFRFFWSEFFRRADGRCRAAVRRHARRSVRRRHLRLPGRRLRPLFDRRAMACAAFREDAVRQRADSRIARSRPCRDADAGLRRAGARDLRLADARNARGWRLRGLAGRRFRRRGRAVLRLERGRDRSRLGRGRGGVQGRLRRARQAAIGRAATCCGG